MKKTVEDKILELFENDRKWWNSKTPIGSQILPYIKDDKFLRKKFNLERTETIIFYNNNSLYDCILTSWGIRVSIKKTSDSTIIEIPWKCVESVKTSERSLDFRVPYLKLYVSAFKDEHFILPGILFIIDEVSWINNLAHILDKYAQISNLNTADMVDHPYESIQMIRAELGKNEYFDDKLLYRLGTIAYNDLKDDEQALGYFGELIKRFKRTNSFVANAHYYCSEILYNKVPNDPSIRRHLFLIMKGNKEWGFALNSVKKFDKKYAFEQKLWQRAKDELEWFDRQYFSEMLPSRPYSERSLIFPVKDMMSLSTLDYSQVMPVSLNALIGNEYLKFPTGHPVANQLYIAHPHCPNVYMLYDDYEIEITNDKLREFSEIAESLGATEIDVKVENTFSRTEENVNTTSVQGGGGYATNKANVGYSTSDNRSREENWSRMFKRHQTFAPSDIIEDPLDTIWLQGEPSWQRLIKQRKSGRLTSHKEIIETKSSCIVSGAATQQLKADLKSLFLDLNIEWNKKEESRYSEQTNFVLSVDIKFSSPSQFNNVVGKKGLIDDISRNIGQSVEAINMTKRSLFGHLSRKLGFDAKKYGNDYDEDFEFTSLTVEEQEYLEEYRICRSEERNLSQSTRRLLNKLARSLNLTEEQINRIEKYVEN